MRSRQQCASFHDDDMEELKHVEFQTLMDQFLYINKQDLHEIVDKINNIPCVISNETGNIIYVNKHWELLSQYDSYEALGKEFCFLLDKQKNIDVCRNFKNDLYQYGHSSMETMYYNKHNQPLSLLVHSKKIKYDDHSVFSDYNYPCFFTTIQKITN